MSSTALRQSVRVAQSARTERADRAWILRLPAWTAVLLLAGGAAAARLPFLAEPLSSDEGGFLMVAAQWSSGTSLYGDYWVDRPPLLIGLFQLADLAGGGPVALRVVGIVCVVASVLCAGLIGRLAAPGRRYATVATVATAAVFLANPLFGATEVDGELLAVPFVLAGLLAVLRAADARGRGDRIAWWFAAGLAAVAAGAVKQSMLEVFVAATVVVGGLLWHRRPARAAEAAAAFTAGAAAAIALLLWWASRHGTTPAGLWGAVVTFRLEASQVISRSAPDTNLARALSVVGSFLASGAIGMLLVAAVPSRRRRPVQPAPDQPAPDQPLQPRGVVDLRALAVAILAWEVFAVAAGGSYWLHYLIGTVPGLVLVAAVTVRHRPARLFPMALVLGYSAAVAAVAVAALAPAVGEPTSNVRVASYLAGHAHPGDTGVVAFGDPALLEAAGLESPYPELWSLPVRVRDPRLTRFTSVLRSADRPAWVVVSGTKLATWGVDADLAQPVLDREYRLVHVDDDWHVYRIRSA